MVQAAEEAADDPAWWPAEVLGVDRRTMDVTIVQLRPAEPLKYQPGQSIAVEIPYRPRQWRYFSPANAPRDDGSIEFHIGLVAGGQVSGPAVRSLRPGDSVRLGAPVGDSLLLPEDSSKDLLMVAGGTGLAPLRAMLGQLDRRPGGIPNVHLFHGARMPWNLYEHNQLLRLTQRPWFSYTRWFPRIRRIPVRAVWSGRWPPGTRPGPTAPPWSVAQRPWSRTPSPS